MMRWRQAAPRVVAGVAAISIALATSACIIDRSALTPLGGETDAASFDAARALDGGPSRDAGPSPDAGAPLDAWSATPLDAPRTPADAWTAPTDTGTARMTDAWSSCGPTSTGESCNARDDDCDGRVDEAACGAVVGPVRLTCAAFEIGAHVYQLCQAGVPVPWDVARSTCEAAPPYRLVTIDDNTENAAVSGHLPGRAWIGLNDVRVEGSFEWVGAPSDFRSWASMEPTSERGSSGDAEDCVSMAGVLWRDEPCGVAAVPPGTDVGLFVCEAEVAR